ncbi:MAG TPA: hypothetical protein VGO71_09170 [Baekduia sp.]|jgi:hypothetical protein|nr:hypothetical protein [Baekduia sp.]
MTTYLLVRELAILAIATAFGAGFMALVHRDDLAGWRVALAPSAGTAIASGLFMTLNLFVPLRHALWFVVLPVALLSVWLVRRSGLRRPPVRELAAMGLVLVVALGAGSYALVKRDSAGPVGYGIFDAPGYITFARGFEVDTQAHPLLDTLAGSGLVWRTPKYDKVAWGETWDLSARYGYGYRWQHTSSNTLNAVASGGIGWAPWTLATALIIAMLATGALGAFGLAGYLGAGPVARTLAGILYSGPLVYTVGMDGSEGLIAGLAVVPSVLVMTIVAFRHPTRRNAALAGALIGGLQAVYPEVLPAVLGGMLLTGAVAFGWPVLRKRQPLSHLTRVLKLLPIATATALLVGLRTLPWTWQYLVGGGYSGYKDSLVPYNMGLKYIPGWLYQTREFYQFAFAHPAGGLQTAIGIVLPVALMLISVAAFVYSDRARWLGGVLLAVVLQAYWASHSFGCAYCVQRTLLILGPLLPALLLTGASLLMKRGGRVRDGVLIVVTFGLVAFASTTIAAQQRMREGLVVAPHALQAATVTAGKLKSTVLLEGMDTLPYSAWLEGPTAYAALTETNPRVSVVNLFQQYGGLAYIDPRFKGHPSWTPEYETVVSRFGSVKFPGRTLVRDTAPYVVQRRAHPFDVTIASGVATDQFEHDPGGAAWVQSPGERLGFHQEPLRFWIAADNDQPSYLRFRLNGPPGVDARAVSGLTGAVGSGSKDGRLDFCARVTSTAATRRVQLAVTPETPPFGPPLRRFENAPVPAKTINVDSLSATSKPCK